jgi:hypothetical protein
MLSRIAAIPLSLLLVFGTIAIASADTLDGTPSDGFWTYGRYSTAASSGNVVLSSLYISTGVVSLLGNNEVTPGIDELFNFSGSGQTSLLTSDPTSADQVFSTITWNTGGLTLGSGFAPSIVTWTAQSAGQYVVSASFTTDQSGNAASAAPVDGQGGSNQDSNNGFVPYSRTVNVKPGDTIDFLSWDGTSSDPSVGLDFQFSPADSSGPPGTPPDPPPDPTPEPSQVVALFGLAGMAMVGLIWDWRRRRPAS